MDNADGTAALPPKDTDKIVQHGHNLKPAEHPGKSNEKNTYIVKDRQKAARARDRRTRIIVRDDHPRYIRAGSTESRNLPRRELRFTDIWR